MLLHVAAGCASVAILLPPSEKPDKWDAADAVAEGFDCSAFIASADRRVIKAMLPVLAIFTLGALLDDNSPLPADLISPRVLTPGGMRVKIDRPLRLKFNQGKTERRILRICG